MSRLAVTDETFMRRALVLAQTAEMQGEVPVGALIVDPDGRVIAEAANGPIGLNDPTAHAEVLALRQAGNALGNYRMPGCTMYVTLEPCAMCAAALVHARMRRLVYGAPDPKTGACGTVLNIPSAPGMNHKIEIVGGELAEKCGELLTVFFSRRR